MKHWLMTKHKLNSQLLYCGYNTRKRNFSAAEGTAGAQKYLSFSLLCTQTTGAFQSAMKSTESFSDCLSLHLRLGVNEPTFPAP